MIHHARWFSVLRSILSHPSMIRVNPAISWFLCKYLRIFTVIDVDGNLIVHSHLPPLNSTAYTRFIREHLIQKIAGPSHAQIGLTTACPQNCEYCYSRDKKGKAMETSMILDVIRDLQRMGVFWLGITGGEPLLNKDIVQVVKFASRQCAVKLFTTGMTLTESRARELKNAGLFSVSVSLDHWKAEEHDKVRGHPGAFKIALKALEIFQEVGGIHVGVSAVLSQEMIRLKQVENFLTVLENLGIHEAWLSEAKPSIPRMWNNCHVISDEEITVLTQLQDRWNKKGGMTVNYLGHFEGRNHFGCAAGNKMVYIDACGNVSPCVFLPMSFGNVHQKPLHSIYSEMRTLFPLQEKCFVNTHYPVMKKHFHGQTPMSEADSRAVMDDVHIGPLTRFFQRMNS
jgi:MoaA/NifB/PqqE/SkfB family radical SAM enzyme